MFPLFPSMMWLANRRREEDQIRVDRRKETIFFSRLPSTRKDFFLLRKIDDNNIDNDDECLLPLLSRQATVRLQFSLLDVRSFLLNRISIESSYFHSHSFVSPILLFKTFFIVSIAFHCVLYFFPFLFTHSSFLFSVVCDDFANARGRKKYHLMWVEGLFKGNSGRGNESWCRRGELWNFNWYSSSREGWQ